MPIEVTAGVAAASVAAAAAAAGGVHEFVKSQRNKWAAENRPCEHPLDCDFRDAFGMMKGIHYTTKDVRKYAKQAARWWHADKNDGVDHGFVDFQRIQKILEVPRLLKAYIDNVEQELQLMEDFQEEMRWRSFNERFLRDLEKKPRIWQAPSQDASSASDGAQAPEIEICHVFLDASGSMTGDSKQKGKSRIEVGYEVFSGLFPRFVDTPTSIHIIGANGGSCGSRGLVSHADVVDMSVEQRVLQSWSAGADATYLWHYIYEQVKDFKDAKHEIIIITDGEDNGSPTPFEGLLGFNELMARLQGGKIRISLSLIGNSLSVQDANSYRDVCLATGGFFTSDESDSSALQGFVVPLLLPEGERDRLAQHQQMEYQSMLQNGEAQTFAWYVALTNGEDGDAATGGGRLPFSPLRRSYGSVSNMPILSPAKRVKLHGLQSTSQLNGQAGTCEKWLADTGRWQVKLDDDGGVKSLKPCNLQVLACDTSSSSQHTYSQL